MAITASQQALLDLTDRHKLLIVGVIEAEIVNNDRMLTLIAQKIKESDGETIVDQELRDMDITSVKDAEFVLDSMEGIQNELAYLATLFK